MLIGARRFLRERHGVLAVIHAETAGQVTRNLDVAEAAGFDGAFLVNHGVGGRELLAIQAGVTAARPDRWVGVNCLDLPPAEVFASTGPGAAAVWIDDSGVRPGTDDQPGAEALAAVRRRAATRPLYFGGVHPGNAGAAHRFVDVLVARGPAGGAPESLDAVRRISRVAGDRPLVVAGGVTVDNVTDYLPYVDGVLVGTGISRSFRDLDPGRARELVERVRAFSRPGSRVQFGPWTDDDGRLPSDVSLRPVGGGPVPGDRLVDVTAGVSLFSGRGAALVRHTRIGDDPRVGDVMSLAGLPADGSYRPARTTSSDPIRDGFLTCLHLAPVPGPYRPGPDPAGVRDGTPAVEPLPAVQEFVAAERARWAGHDIESYLRRLYGQLPDDVLRQDLFRFIDYPVFDSGTLAVGFGVLACDGVWIWSRVVCHHK